MLSRNDKQLRKKAKPAASDNETLPTVATAPADINRSASSSRSFSETHDNSEEYVAWVPWRGHSNPIKSVQQSQSQNKSTVSSRISSSHGTGDGELHSERSSGSPSRSKEPKPVQHAQQHLCDNPSKSQDSQATQAAYAPVLSEKRAAASPLKVIISKSAEGSGACSVRRLEATPAAVATQQSAAQARQEPACRSSTHGASEGLPASLHVSLTVAAPLVPASAAPVNESRQESLQAHAQSVTAGHAHAEQAHLDDAVSGQVQAQPGDHLSPLEGLEQLEWGAMETDSSSVSDLSNDMDIA